MSESRVMCMVLYQIVLLHGVNNQIESICYVKCTARFGLSIVLFRYSMVCCHDYSEWKKILFRRQCFPDNYSGGEQQFLRELKKNVSAAKYSYLTAVYGVARLLCHLNIITLLYIVFENVSINSFSAYTLSVSLVIFSAILYFIDKTVLSENSVNFVDDIYTLATLLIFGFAFTPVIRTLTNTISSDTVYALSFFFAIISCIFHDYGIKAPIVSFSLSVSSGLSSEVFLISQLGSNIQAFAMLSAAFAIHAYSPIFRNRLFTFHPVVSSFLTLSLSLCSTYFLHIIYFELAIVWLLIQIFLIFICPYILVLKQKEKRTIHGPWDEAIPLNKY